jgi:hypothetical protein
MTTQRSLFRLVCSTWAVICLPLFAQTADPPAFPQPRITTEEWQDYFSQVKALPGARVFERSAPDQVIVQLPKSVVYVFTAPAHPAHPAVVRRQVVVDVKGDVRFARVGHFAGDEAAFVAWQRQFEELERKSVEEVQRRLREGKQ